SDKGGADANLAAFLSDQHHVFDRQRIPWRAHGPVYRHEPARGHLRLMAAVLDDSVHNPPVYHVGAELARPAGFPCGFNRVGAELARPARSGSTREIWLGMSVSGCSAPSGHFSSTRVPLIFWLLSALRKLGTRRSISSKYDDRAGVFCWAL